MTTTSSSTVALNVAELHRTSARMLTGALVKLGVPRRELADALQATFLTIHSNAHKFDPTRAGANTFCALKAREVATTFRRHCRAEVSTISEQDLIGEDETSDGFTVFGLSARADDADFSVRLTAFMTALQRKLTPTEGRVFDAAGGLTSLSVSAEDRGSLEARLGISDTSLRHHLAAINQAFQALWPDHFDAALSN